MPLLGELFAAGRPIVGLCASGILIRAVAPLLADKRAEPPVVALAEDGSVAVPLLGGHHGANALARAIAEALRLRRRDHHGGRSAARFRARRTAARLAHRQPGAGQARWPRRCWPASRSRLSRKPPAPTGCVPGPFLGLRRTPLVADASGPTLSRMRERRFGGVGRPTGAIDDATRMRSSSTRRCWRSASAASAALPAEEVAALARDTLAEAGLAAGAVAAVVSIELKADEAGIHALARRSACRRGSFRPRGCSPRPTRLTMRSEAAFRATGCWGVAEGAALAAAGPDGVLVVPRRQSRRATCAIARAATPIDAGAIGRPRGRLAIVGIGPGDPAWRTPEASALLAAADDIVGYGSISICSAARSPASAGTTARSAQEAARARLALDLAAAAGRSRWSRPAMPAFTASPRWSSS